MKIEGGLPEFWMAPAETWPEQIPQVLHRINPKPGLMGTRPVRKLMTTLAHNGPFGMTASVRISAG